MSSIYCVIDLCSGYIGTIFAQATQNASSDMLLMPLAADNMHQTQCTYHMAAKPDLSVKVFGY